MDKYAPYIAGVGFATIFGFSFLFTREALDHIAPFHLLGLRFATAATAMGLLRLAGVLRFKVSLSGAVALLPLAAFQPLMYFACETISVQLTSASQAGMMIAVVPVFVAILAALVLKEPPKARQLPFIILSVAGVLFIALMQNSNLSGHTLGTLALLGAVFAGACYSIASRHAARTFTPLQTTWVMMVIGAVVFNAVALMQHLFAGNLAQYFAPMPVVWPAVAYLGLLSSVVAFFLINFSLSRLTAPQSAVFANLVTVIAVAAGVVLRGEDFFWYHALGATAIILGVWGTNHFGRQVHATKIKPSA